MTTKRAFDERDKLLARGDGDLFPCLERCCKCDAPTGKAGREEDSLYAGADGPYCEECWCGVAGIYSDDVTTKDRT